VIIVIVLAQVVTLAHHWHCKLLNPIRRYETFDINVETVNRGQCVMAL